MMSVLMETCYHSVRIIASTGEEATVSYTITTATSTGEVVQFPLHREFIQSVHKQKHCTHSVNEGTQSRLYVIYVYIHKVLMGI